MSENLLNYIKLNNGYVNIKVIAKSSENKISFDNDFLKVKIREVAENGRANSAIINLFSKTLGLSKNKIKIVRGTTNSKKLIFIDVDDR